MPTALATADHRPQDMRWAAAAGLGLLAAATRWRIRHRRSPAVRCWRPGGGDRRIAGGLSLRTLGEGERVVILLHGLAASGDYFGAGYDQLADEAQLVVPDLLGFGRSLNGDVADYSLDAHLAALDRMARELQLDGRALTLAGHSLGGLLALHWAARRSDVDDVVCFGTPLYTGAQEADERIRAMGPVERLFATQGPVPEALCGWMCRRRAIAQAAAVALEPRFPVPITRMAVSFSWASHLGAINGVIRDGGWQAPLAALAAARLPVLLADGALDPVPVRGRAEQLAMRHANVTVAEHRGAGHQLPLTQPSWCAGQILTSRRRRTARSTCR